MHKLSSKITQNRRKREYFSVTFAIYLAELLRAVWHICARFIQPEHKSSQRRFDQLFFTPLQPSPA
jgi:hypothetical protein